jgi:3-hydroxyacyl-[acyl-carrier-protein] dehydratase
LLLSHDQIKTLMPHRYPMLLVDAIVSMERWKSVVGIKNVTCTEACYAAIRDGAPLRDYAYPASLIIESFGQTGGVLISDRRRHEKAPEDVLMIFGGVSGFRFLADVYPGDTMVHRVQIEKETNDFAVLTGEVRVRDVTVAEIDSIIAVYRRSDQVSTAMGSKG